MSARFTGLLPILPTTKLPIAMPQQRLMTPGPTEVPETALLSMARQVTHHRTPEFRALLAESFAGLKYAFATENDVLVLTSSGTGAMEAAVVNLVPQGRLHYYAAIAVLRELLAPGYLAMCVPHPNSGQ